MTIRPASTDDIDQVIPLVAKVCAFHAARDPQRYGFVENVQRMYRGWLIRRTADDQSVFLVAERPASPTGPAQIVGFLVADTERDLPIYRTGRIGFIHDLWVEPDYRNEGLGRRLVMQAIEQFRELGVDQIRLDVLIHNPAARELFEACGFRSSTVQMLYDPRDAPSE